jgi:hypothetical protein
MGGYKKIKTDTPGQIAAGIAGIISMAAVIMALLCLC